MNPDQPNTTVRACVSARPLFNDATLANNRQSADAVPQKLELIPAGAFTGRDKRSWLNPNPESVIKATRSNNKAIPFDVEHSTHLQAPEGKPAPAIAWIEPDSLELVDGAIWGAVDWNDKGKTLVMNREYRYYSPSFENKKGIVTLIRSVGLTNEPNLEIPAMNREAETSVLQEIATALGLDEGAVISDVIDAIKQLKTGSETDNETALNQQGGVPFVSGMVPKESYEFVLNRAESAELALNQQQYTEREEVITRLVDEAVTGGKIPPVNRDYYLSMCRTKGGLEEFKVFAKKAPKIVNGDSGLFDRSPPVGGSQLSEDELSICRSFNRTTEEYLKLKENN